MRFTDIRRYLKPYSILANRTTTINHAFAASIAPSDAFDTATVRAAVIALGQDPDADLRCVYCGDEAETWDHVHATVKDKAFSGHGHRLGNLLPCCKRCNSKKGNRDWRTFLGGTGLPEAQRAESERRIDGYLTAYGVRDVVPEHLSEYQELQELRRQVLELFARADRLAGIVRTKSGAIPLHL
jgi:hypothetical protein